MASTDVGLAQAHTTARLDAFWQQPDLLDGFTQKVKTIIEAVTRPLSTLPELSRLCEAVRQISFTPPLIETTEIQKGLVQLAADHSRRMLKALDWRNDPAMKDLMARMKAVERVLDRQHRVRWRLYMAFAHRRWDRRLVTALEAALENIQHMPSSDVTVKGVQNFFSGLIDLALELLRVPASAQLPERVNSRQSDLFKPPRPPWLLLLGTSVTPCAP